MTTVTTAGKAETNQARLIRDITYPAVFAALTIACAFVSIPAGPLGVPIVLQNAIILLTAMLLGTKRGMLAVTIFLALGLVGLPVLAGGRSVIAALGAPSIGYVIGYFFCPLVTGPLSGLARRTTASMTIWFTLASIAGLLVQYFFGVLYLAYFLTSHGKTDGFGAGLSKALAIQVPYLPGACIKTIAIIFIAVVVHTAIRNLRTLRPVSAPTI